MSVLEAFVFCARAPTGAKLCAAHQALARRAGTAARLAFACRGMPTADARKPVGVLPCGGTIRHTAWKSRNADCRTRWMPPAAAHCVPNQHHLGACGSSPLAGPVAARALPEIRGSSPVRPSPGPPLRHQRCWLSCMLPHLRSQRLRHHSSWCLACTTRARRSCPT